MSIKQKIIVILGPTASGKSDLAVKIALRLSSGQVQKKYNIKGAEIISADSRQVYRSLDLGSGKVPRDMSKVKGQKSKVSNDFYYKKIQHHLIDVASPKKTFTVQQYQKLGQYAIKKILAKKKIPIICGGTGLYIDSLIYNWQFPQVPPQIKLRKKLEKISTEKLFEKLKKLDPQRAKNIDKYNRRRLIRALEIVITTKKPVPSIISANPLLYSNNQRQSTSTLFIGIKKSKEELKKAITKRLYKRLKQGMIGEVKNLYKQGLSWKRLDNFGLEYRFISRYLRELINKKEMEKLIIKESQRYAKRQMTWFKRNTEIHWVNNKNQTLKLVNKFIISR